MSTMSIEVDSFYDYMVRVRKKATALKYRDSAIRFLAFLARNGVPFRAMPPNVLSLFSENLVHEGLKPRSVVVFVAGAKRFLEWSKARGDTNIDVQARVDLPKITKESPNALRNEHLLAFLALASRKKEPVRSALLLLPYCGLRQAELLSLRLSDIKKVSIPATGGRPATTYYCFDVVGKGGDRRTVPILSDGTPLLLKYLTDYRRHVKGPWLFPNTDGTQLSDRTLRWNIGSIQNRMKVRRLSLHTLRRTYLTTLHRAGVDIPTLTKIAGHKSVQTTMSHYLEILPEDLVKSIDGVGARLVERSSYASLVDDRTADVLSYLKSRKTEDEE